MEELIRLYGPQAAIIIAVVLYLKKVMEDRLEDCKRVGVERLAEKDAQITKLERERDEMKELAFRATGVTERVVAKVASPATSVGGG